MGNLFNLDNPIWQFMGKLVDVFILTILWAVCCIPIFTIGPASTAVYYVTLKLVRDEESYTVRSFFKSFKENFKQGVAIGLIMTFLLLFFVYDIYAYFMMGTQITTILGIVFLGVFLLYLIALVYVYPLQAKFYNKIRYTLRNALFIGVKHLFRSLAMILIAVVVIVGCLFFPPLILLSYGLIAFLQSYFLVRIFDKYIPKEDKEDSDSVVAEARRELEAQGEEEQRHVVMTQQEQDVSDVQVFSREMFASRTQDATDSTPDSDGKEADANPESTEGADVSSEGTESTDDGDADANSESTESTDDNDADANSEGTESTDDEGADANSESTRV